MRCKVRACYTNLAFRSWAFDMESVRGVRGNAVYIFLPTLRSTLTQQGANTISRSCLTANRHVVAESADVCDARPVTLSLFIVEVLDRSNLHT
jgi:hypothetical protein